MLLEDGQGPAGPRLPAGSPPRAPRGHADHDAHGPHGTIACPLPPHTHTRGLPKVFPREERDGSFPRAGPPLPLPPKNPDEGLEWGDPTGEASVRRHW